MSSLVPEAAKAMSGAAPLDLRVNTLKAKRPEVKQILADAGIEVLDARISHLAYAPEIAQAMLQRQQASALLAAREKIVARSDEDRQDFLRKRGFSKAETGRIVETVLAEEGRPPESVFDFVQGITACHDIAAAIAVGAAKGRRRRLAAA